MRLYLVRHGQTILNQKACYYGWTDVSLSQEGRIQARKLGRFFSEYVFDSVITSPLLRARETAEIIMAERTKEKIKNDKQIEKDIGKNGSFSKVSSNIFSKDIVKTDDRLKEQNFGIFEGRTYEELQENYPREVSDWNKDFSNYRIPEGESFLDVRRRIDSFCMEMPKEKGNLLLVAHKGTLGHLLASYLHLPPEGYWNFAFDQGCYSRVDLEDGYAIIRKLNQNVE